MAVLASKEVAAGAGPVEVYRHQPGGPKLVSVLMASLSDVDIVTSRTELLLAEAAATRLGVVTRVEMGGGYKTMPTVRYTSRAQVVPRFAARMELASVDLKSRGIGYTVGDTFTILEGEGSAGRVRVGSVDDSGRILTLTWLSRGLFTSLKREQATVKVVEGTGKYAYLDLTYRVDSLITLDAGAGFLEPPGIEIEGSARFSVAVTTALERRHLLLPTTLGYQDTAGLKELSLEPGDALFVSSEKSLVAVTTMGST